MQYESAEKESSRSLVSLQGLDGKHLVVCRRGEAFVLTSSFIERDYRNLAFGPANKKGSSPIKTQAASRGVSSSLLKNFVFQAFGSEF
jgi:hypothetical protein